MKMKKTLFFALFVIMLVTVLTSCSISDIKCMKPFNMHTIVIDEAVEATCTTKGLTQGEHCADCGMVFVAQSIIPEIPHTEVIDKAVESTCTKTGLTEGSHCSECGLVFVAQTKVDKKPHREVVSSGYASTCTTDGRTDRTYCGDCKVDIIPSTTIPKGHKNVITIDAVDSTCSSVGFTEGKFCVDCMTMIEGYYTIPMKAHTSSGEWIVVKEATRYEAGSRYQICTVCDGVAIEEVIPQIAEFEYAVNEDGVSCTVTGVTVYANIELYIPEYIDGYKVTAIGNDAFSGETRIIVAYIPGGVTSIGARAFSGCTGLAKVDIPEGVASIGVAAFYNCSRLTSIVLPTTVTSIGHAAFDACEKLDSVYYAGTAEMWSYIDEIGVNNEAITDVNNRYYYFAEDPRKTETGIFRENGELYFYMNGSKKGAGLIVIDGAFYYVRTSGDAKGLVISNATYWVTAKDGPISSGNYTFDINGKMIDPPVEPGENTVEITRYWHYVDGTPTKW